MLLTVMTFNVRGSFHPDGVNNWDQRRDLNIATILKHAPDVIGFQEAQSGNLDAYVAELAEYDVELGALSIRQTKDYHRVPIFWRADRFEKVDCGSFYLSDTPDTWSIGWGTIFARAVTWVKLRSLVTGIEFVVLNTHFPHLPDADTARTESARLVVRRLAEITANTCPAVVLADFNAVPTSDAYRVFMQHRYQDTYTANGSRADVNTFHGFRGRDFDEADLRIDWILTKNGAQSFTTLRCIVITDEAPPLYPSDHYPVQAELELV